MMFLLQFDQHRSKIKKIRNKTINFGKNQPTFFKFAVFNSPQSSLYLLRFGQMLRKPTMCTIYAKFAPGSGFYKTVCSVITGIKFVDFVSFDYPNKTKVKLSVISLQ